MYYNTLGSLYVSNIFERFDIDTNDSIRMFRSNYRPNGQYGNLLMENPKDLDTILWSEKLSRYNYVRPCYYKVIGIFRAGDLDSFYVSMTKLDRMKVSWDEVKDDRDIGILMSSKFIIGERSVDVLKADFAEILDMIAKKCLGSCYTIKRDKRYSAGGITCYAPDPTNVFDGFASIISECPFTLMTNDKPVCVVTFGIRNDESVKKWFDCGSILAETMCSFFGSSAMCALVIINGRYKFFWKSLRKYGSPSSNEGYDYFCFPHDDSYSLVDAPHNVLLKILFHIGLACIV